MVIETRTHLEREEPRWLHCAPEQTGEPPARYLVDGSSLQELHVGNIGRLFSSSIDMPSDALFAAGSFTLTPMLASLWLHSGHGGALLARFGAFWDAATTPAAATLLLVEVKGACWCGCHADPVLSYMCPPQLIGMSTHPMMTRNFSSTSRAAGTRCRHGTRCQRGEAGLRTIPNWRTSSRGGGRRLRRCADAKGLAVQ